MLAGGGLVVMIGVFIYFVTAIKPEVPDNQGQNVVTKNESKTYLKYVALNGDQASSPTQSVAAPTSSPSPTLKPSVTNSPPLTPEASPSAVVNGNLTTTPDPTEIILAVESPTNTAETVATTNEPTQEIASLPTTGVIDGGLLIFLISFSMIAFAFVL